MAELTQTSGKGSSRTKKMNIRVDLTAMVDLAFLLITFFILTTTLSKPSSMELVMPVDIGEGPVSESRTLTLCLGNHNKLFWYTGTIEKLIQSDVTNFERNGIRDILVKKSKEVLAKTGKTLMVLIKPSDQSKYENLIDVLDELNITQVPSYTIVDITKEDIKRLKNKGIY